MRTFFIACLAASAQIFVSSAQAQPACAQFTVAVPVGRGADITMRRFRDEVSGIYVEYSRDSAPFVYDRVDAPQPATGSVQSYPLVHPNDFHGKAGSNLNVRVSGSWSDDNNNWHCMVLALPVATAEMTQIEFMTIAGQPSNTTIWVTYK
jgi:hypothetical protein